MNQLQKVPFVLISVFIVFALILVSPAFGKPSKQTKLDARAAAKTLQKTRESITTTINTSNTLAGDIRLLGKCSGEILSNSPGWESNNKKEINQTDAAFTLAYLAAGGYAVQATVEASYWAEGTLRSAAWGKAKAVRPLLKGNADFVKMLRNFGKKEVALCSILESWQDAGYTGIYNLANVTLGEDGLQSFIEKGSKITRRIYKGIININRILSGRVGSLSSPYARADGSFYQGFFSVSEEKRLAPLG